MTNALDRYYYEPSKDQPLKARLELSSQTLSGGGEKHAEQAKPFSVEQSNHRAMQKLGSIARYQDGDPVGSYKEGMSYGSPVVTKYAQDRLLNYLSLISYETMSPQHYNMDVLDTSQGIQAQAQAGIKAVEQANNRSAQEVFDILSGKAEGKLTCIDASKAIKSVLDQAGIENGRIITNIGVNHALNIMKMGDEFVVLSVDHPGATPTIVRGKTPEDVLNGYIEHIHGKRGKLDSGKITFQDEKGNPIGIYRTSTRKALEQQMGADTDTLARSISYLNGNSGFDIKAGSTQIGNELIAGGSASWTTDVFKSSNTRIRANLSGGAATILSPKQDPVGATLAASGGIHLDHSVIGGDQTDHQLTAFANATGELSTTIDPTNGLSMPDIQGRASLGAVYSQNLEDGAIHATAQVNALYGTPTNHQSFGARYDGYDASVQYKQGGHSVGIRGGESKAEGSRYIGLDAKYAISDDFSINGSISQTNQDFGSFYTKDTLNATAGAELSKPNSPISYFAQVNHSRDNQGGDADTGGAIGMKIRF